MKNKFNYLVILSVISTVFIVTTAKAQIEKPVKTTATNKQPITKQVQTITSIVGKWEGTWGSGESYGTNYYSLKFNADGSMQLVAQNGTIYANGIYSFSANQLNGSYVYTNGAKYTIAAFFSDNKLYGTWINAINSNDGGRWVISNALPQSTINPLTIQNTNQAPPPPPKTNNPPPTTVNTPHYYLTAARVSIVTGNDNKEEGSKVNISLVRPSGGEWPSDDNTKSCGLYQFIYSKINNEYRVNSVTDIPLVTSFQFPAGLPGGAGEGWRYINLRLGDIQIHGLTLYVMYEPNFILDAWKIERVTLTLEFKDLAGNAHPTLGTVVIPFINSSVLLRDGNRTLKVETDKFLIPKN